MFLKNKYTLCYNTIIDKALNRDLDKSIYTEKHHIVPKSLGGSNFKNNLVILSAKEHFVCHLLLTKMTEGKEKLKMVYAAWAMANLATYNQHREKITGSSYARLREIVSAQHAKFRTGKKHSEETKQKQRKPKNFKDGISPLSGISRLQSVKDKISSSKFGKSHTAEHTKNVAEGRKIKTEYNWKNPEYNEIRCTMWDILEKYPNTTKVGLRHVIYGYQTTHRNWSIIRCTNDN